MLTPAELTTYIREQIPITVAMGVEIVEFSGNAVRASAPLEANINHQESAFGGSIDTLGILTGFVALVATLKQHGQSVHLVIQHSETEFSKPAVADMQSESRPISDAALKEFLGSLQRSGQARMLVTSDLFSEGRLIAKNTSTFVGVVEAPPERSKP